MDQQQHAPLKERVQAKLRRLLSKIRHEESPPPVPPKDEKPRQLKFPSYYSPKHKRTERDGRHDQEQATVPHNNATAALEDFPAPPTSGTAATPVAGQAAAHVPTLAPAKIGKEPPYLMRQTQDEQPLMARQELADIDPETVGIARTSNTIERSDGGQTHLPQHQGGHVVSMLDLENKFEQQTLDDSRPQHEPQVATRKHKHSPSQETWGSGLSGVGGGAATERTSSHDSSPVTPTSTHEAAPGKYKFPEQIPEDTTDKTIDTAKPVVHERVQRQVHEVVQEQVHREVHHYDEYYYIQPVKDVQVLPTRHVFVDEQGNASEIKFEGGVAPPGFTLGHQYHYEERHTERETL